MIDNSIFQMFKSQKRVKYLGSRQYIRLG